jgi:large subunit ribosomal protein L21
MATKAKTTKKETAKTVKKAPAKKASKTSSPSSKSSKLAVIKTGGKQYLVEEGQIIKIEKIKGFDAEKSKGKVVFDEVLLLIDGEKVEVGTPSVKSKVEAEVIEEGRSKKVSVIKYKSKSRYFRNKGHRQPFLKVKITKIG